MADAADGSTEMPDAGPRWILEVLGGTPYAMNRAGSFTFTTRRTQNDLEEAWIRLDDGRIQYIGGLAPDGGVAETVPIAISDDGCVVGTSHLLSAAPGGHPFMWCAASGMVPLDTNGEPLPDFRPLAINSAHRIVGIHRGTPWLWVTPTQGMALPTLARPNGAATGVNSSGVIVGWGQFDSGYTTAVEWKTSSEIAVLGGFDQADFAASGIADDGGVFGSSTAGACVWTDALSQPPALPLSAPDSFGTVFRVGAGAYPLGYQRFSGSRPYATAWVDAGPQILEDLAGPDSGCELWFAVGTNAATTRFIGTAVCSGVTRGYLLEFR